MVLLFAMCWLNKGAYIFAAASRPYISRRSL